MKYLAGYITAAVFGSLTWVLMQFGDRFSILIDMVYPYVIRTAQDYLAKWTGSVDFCLWQVLAMALLVIVLATVVLMIVLKWNPIQWFGWVLAVGSLLFLLHTAFFGLNYNAGTLADDMRLEVSRYTLDELSEATTYYRDKANALADQVNRDGQGNVSFASFEDLAKQAPDGFHTLTYDRYYPIFAGSAEPVKKLGWEDLCTSLGITGMTMGLTGEAAVNPQIPQVILPYTMCREMAHRMCIATERDANFAAFLSGSVNSSLEFQYSSYFMAFRYCYTALSSLKHEAAAASAAQIGAGIGENLKRDLDTLDLFYKKGHSALADSIYHTYLRISGDPTGVNPGNEICNLLVNWHIQQVVLPSIAVTETPFDPYDEAQVDLSGIVNARQ